MDLLAFVVVTGLVMVVPGPSVLFAVTHRLRGGPGAGLWAILGLESGLAIHVTVACAGVSAVVAASPTLLTALKLVGAAYLLVLGLRQLGSRPEGDGSGVTPRSSKGSIYRDGLLIDLTNPKTVIYFAALLPQFLDPSAGSVAHQTLLLGACVVALALMCDAAYTLLAGWCQRRLSSPGSRWHQSSARWGRRVSGCCFVVLAGVAALG